MMPRTCCRKDLSRFSGIYTVSGPKALLRDGCRRVFVNTSIEHFRRKSTKLSTVSDKEEDTIEDADITALDSLAEKDIISLIQELSPGYRTVFNLYVVEGYSHKEIGDLLGISEGTSKSQLARAKGILQKKVAQYFRIPKNPIPGNTCHLIFNINF